MVAADDPTARSKPMNPAPQPARSLPLAEPAAVRPEPTLPTEGEIRALVNAFYDQACKDAILGPVFNHHVEDWSVHLPKMYDFWSAVVLRTGRYAGRPFEAHAGLPELSPAHFERWLALWEATVERVIAPGAREGFTAAAGRMAAAMSSRLFSDHDDN